MDFFIGFDKEGNLKFASRKMEKNWNRLKSFYGQSGSFFQITVETNPSKNSTGAQHKLFKRICKMVETDTGQDYSDVQKELLKLTPMKEKPSLFGDISERHKTLEELTTKEFSVFLEAVLVMVNNVMNCNYTMYHDDNLGTIITKES